MGRKRARWGDNPLRGWFRFGLRIIRVLYWTNYEPLETARGKSPERCWTILRKSKANGVHLEVAERYWTDEIKKWIVDGWAVLEIHKDEGIEVYGNELLRR